MKQLDRRELEGSMPLIDRPSRRLVEMRGYVIRCDHGDEIVDVRILDLCYDGCGVETLSDLGEGEAVKLSILGRGAVAAKVRWMRGRKAGLMFATLRAADRKHWPRRLERASLDADVLFRRSGKLGYRVRVFDASCDGCKCEFVERPNIGERVWVKFQRLEAMEAEVCWIEGFNAGIRFVQPMHPAVFGMLISGSAAL